ncbi:MAG TPA: DUF2298 domain-containing protein [Ktedonobacterales bacterium]|nr:DUF2298 domain-containing protein [Ktedonobacterales bacterium]
MSELFAWWLAAELIGVAGLPLCALVFANLPDHGWALARPLGLITFGWLVWLPLAAISALPYSPGWIIGVFLVFAAGNVMLALRVPRIQQALRRMLARERAYIATCELLFAGAFGLMAWVRSFTPAVVDTEKFMDVAFLSSLWRTPHLPAPDPWLSGAPINYYYFGHFLLATLAKVLGTQPGAAFNIGIALIFALTAVAVFGVAANLAALARRSAWQRALPAASLPRSIPYGLTAVLLVLVLGNLNAAQDWWQQALAATGHGQPLTNPWQWWLHRDLWTTYSWWNPSRVIPNTINEFPAFSFILSDLHAHVLALPFTALAVGIALNLLLARGEGLRAYGRGPLGLLALATSAVAIGGLYAINGWDLPTYLGLAVLALAMQQYLAHDRRINSLLLLDLFAAAALLIALCFLAYLPFYRGFSSPSQGIGAVTLDQRTPVGYEFAIFGLPLFILGSLIIWRVAQWTGAALESATAEAMASGAAESGGPWGWLSGRARWIGETGAVAVFVLLLFWTARSPGNTGFTLFWCLLVILLCAALALRHLGIFGTREAIAAGTRGSDERERTTGADMFDHPAEDGERYAELWILCVAGTAAALVAATEVVYLRDIYSSRMNTVFKLYFQAWLLLGITAGPALAWLLPTLRRQLGELFAPIAASHARTASTPAAGLLAVVGGASTRTSLPALRGDPSATNAKSRIAAESATASPLAAHGVGAPPAEPASVGALPAAPAGPGVRLPFPAESATTPDFPLYAESTRGGASDPVGTERAQRGAAGLGMRFPLTGGAGFPLALRWLRAGGILIWMGTLTALTCAALVFPLLATSSRTANFSLPRTLDGTAYMATDPAAAAVGCTGVVGAGTNAHDDGAIAWLNTHITGSPVIVEAPGCEWTHYSRISSFTGLPTLIGWPGGHEGEWRANWLNNVSPNDPFGGRYFGQRIDAVNHIYTDLNNGDVIALLKQYDVRLIYVGAAERQLYANADLSRFGTFLRVIYARDGVTIYQVPW